jgi:hypothetical protein
MGVENGINPEILQNSEGGMGPERADWTLSEYVDGVIDRADDMKTNMQRIANRQNYDKSDFQYRLEEAREMVTLLEEALEKAPEPIR